MRDRAFGRKPAEATSDVYSSREPSADSVGHLFIHSHGLAGFVLSEGNAIRGLLATSDRCLTEFGARLTPPKRPIRGLFSAILPLYVARRQQVMKFWIPTAPTNPSGLTLEAFFRHLQAHF